MNQLKLTSPHPFIVFRLVFTFCMALLLTNGSISSAQIPVLQREVNTIPVVINDVPVTNTFFRGLSYSKPTFADIDKDGNFDLFVGDAQSNLRFYRNTGTAANPVFTLVTVNFVSIHAVFYSAPSFADIDNDRDLDLFVGNSDGSIYFYRNTGTANPAFTLETTNFASIDVGGYSVPSFADIDKDGDLDLFVGEEAGNINFYRNIGTAANPTFTLETENLAAIFDAESNSAPNFADIDNDADLDLFVGEADGNINFYRNTGTATNPAFTLETTNFASIVVNYSVPSFADIDKDGDLDLFVGKVDGNIFYYSNTGTATNPAFTKVTENFAFIDFGDDSAPSFADIDNDGDFDLFVGERAGNINFYRNTGTATNPEFTLETTNLGSIDVGNNSVPSFADIDKDGDLDLFVGARAGNIFYYSNTGTATIPALTLVTENFASIDVGDYSTPSFADIDNDGDGDLFVGEFDGNLNFYRNTGTATSPVFTLVTDSLASFDVDEYSIPSFADIDKDGDVDLFVGFSLGNISYYRNDGTITSPVFNLKKFLLPSVNGDINIGGRSTPTFVDIDNDGDLDLFLGEFEGGLHFYRNVTSNRLPVVANAISNQTLTVGGAAFTRNLNASPAVFNDPDGDALTYTASSSVTNIATAGIFGTTLTVSPVAAGSATITVTADDGRDGIRSTTFTVTVGAGVNRPPTVANAISNQTLTVGGAAFTRNLNASPAVFSDPDGDALTYTAISSATNIATASISGSTLTVAAVTTGNATITVTANDGRGGTVSTNFMVTVTVAMNRPPVVLIAIPNQNLTVGGAPFVRDLNSAPQVFNDPDGDALFYSINSSAASIAMASVSISTVTVTQRAAGSATITVTANDNRGGIVSTNFTVTVNLPAYPSTLPLSTTVNYPSRPNASDYPAADYRIVGLPGASNRLVNEFLSGAQNQDWQVFRDNGAASNFFVTFDGSASFQFSVGRAFWIISKRSFSAGLTASSAPLNAMQEIEIPLQNGWNLITNPFTASVLWSKIQTANNVTEPIWAFNGSFSQADTFKTYAGYYFFNATNLSLLKIPYSAYFSGGSAADMVSTNWRVHISLTAGKFNEQAVSFGVANEASHELDGFDFRKPRALAATPTVEFKRPIWDASYSIFASDIRPEFEDAESWEFDVRAISREASQLTFSGISKIPNRFEVYLIDADHAQSVNLREDSLYQFTPAAELLKFKVVVGRKEKVQEQLNSLALPKDFALGPNYPNPFSQTLRFAGNPTTTIPVAVPAASEIKLKIYNLLGAEVKTIYAGSIEAGRYWFNWDGRNALGENVATGVYLFQLRASTGIALQGKMILIR